MDAFIKLCSVLLSIIFISTALAQDTCVAKGPCSCEFSNGTGIDLAAAVSTTFYHTTAFREADNDTIYEMQTYFYHPCFDTRLPGVNDTKLYGCGNPLTICRQMSTMAAVNGTPGTFKLGAAVYDFLGTSNQTTFSPDGQFITYQNGPSSTTVKLVCAQIDGKLQVESLAEPNKLVLGFYSREACLKQLSTGGRSFGSTLCIIFFSLVIFYLVLGVLTRKFLMGATGVEVVPNLAFWVGLPLLVKDGWAFALNGFKLPERGVSGAAASPDPNSYDSI